MGLPRFLVENFFNLDMFPGHTVSAEEEATDHEARVVGAVRRHPRNFWTPTTANSDTWLQAACDRVRCADMIVGDRVHNLSGETVSLEVSSDGFTTSTEVFSLTFPTYVFRGSRLDQLPGVLTEEGAWCYKFPFHHGKQWRFNVGAMGAGEKPQVGGLYLGKSWQSMRHPQMPSDDEPQRLAFEQKVSPALWSGSNRKARRRESGSTPMVIPLASDLEHDQVRYHFKSLYWAGRHMWIVFDDEVAERAVLAEAPPGVHGAPWQDPYLHRVLTVHWNEYNPKAA